MRKKLDLRFTLVDQYGSRAVVEGQELDRVTEHWGLQRIIEAFYDDIPTSICPACKTSLQDALETGLMGCPACYEFIYPEYLAKIEKNPQTSPNSGSSPGSNQVS